MFNKIYEWMLSYSSSGLISETISIPMVEAIVLLLVLTICLLLRFSSIGLIVAYLFVYRWAWCFREQIFSNDPYIRSIFTTSYIVFGILVFVFVIIGMICAKTVEK